MTSIENYAFSSCKIAFVNLYWEDPSVCTLADYALRGINSDATVYVPVGAISAYGSHEKWTAYNLQERETGHGVYNITMAAKYGTFCPSVPVDFTNVEGLSAYVASYYQDGVVTVTRINDVPAGTGLLLIADEPGEYTVNPGVGNAYIVNLLRGTTLPIVLNPTTGSYTNFTLAKGDDGINFYPSTGGPLAAGKAYLQVPTSYVTTASGTRPLEIRFDEGTTTGIESVAAMQQQTGPVYDLQGRRFAQPTKGGVYIVGGKKVVVN